MVGGHCRIRRVDYGDLSFPQEGEGVFIRPELTSGTSGYQDVRRVNTEETDGVNEERHFADSRIYPAHIAGFKISDRSPPSDPLGVRKVFFENQLHVGVENLWEKGRLEFGGPPGAVYRQRALREDDYTRVRSRRHVLKFGGRLCRLDVGYEAAGYIGEETVSEDQIESGKILAETGAHHFAVDRLFAHHPGNRRRGCDPVADCRAGVDLQAGDLTDEYGWQSFAYRVEGLLTYTGRGAGVFIENVRCVEDKPAFTPVDSGFSFDPAGRRRRTEEDAGDKKENQD